MSTYETTQPWVCYHYGLTHDLYVEDNEQIKDLALEVLARHLLDPADEDGEST